MRKKQFRTSVLIDNEREPPLDDLKWIMLRRFKPTSLLRSKIKELRAIEEGAPTIEGLKTNLLSFQNKLEKLCKVLEKILSKEQFAEIMEKI